MTEFKVGDRVTLSGVVTRTDPFYGEWCVRIDGGVYGDTRLTYDQSKLAALSESSGKDTTFRDQAAIAALQGVLASGREFNCDIEVQRIFNIAEVFDLERKKRGGV